MPGSADGCDLAAAECDVQPDTVGATAQAEVVAAPPEAVAGLVEGHFTVCAGAVATPPRASVVGAYCPSEQMQFSPAPAWKAGQLRGVISSSHDGHSAPLARHSNHSDTCGKLPRFSADADNAMLLARIREITCSLADVSLSGKDYGMALRAALSVYQVPVSGPRLVVDEALSVMNGVMARMRPKVKEAIAEDLSIGSAIASARLAATSAPTTQTQ